ncbi:MAG: adenylyltransferase/cytidyltransferase family protein [Nitrospiria bacterium]
MKKVLTFGVFDMLHVGHIELLKEAKALGDYLVVGVYTDEVAESFKRKPIISFAERIRMISELKIVDEVVPLITMSPELLISALGIRIVAKGPGAGWGEDTVNLVPTFKGALSCLLPYHPGTSTSDIIRRCKES